MNITDVRIKLVENAAERLLAFCAITIDGCFVVRDLKIIGGPTGLFVAMPSRKLTSHCHSCWFKIHCGQCIAASAARSFWTVNYLVPTTVASGFMPTLPIPSTLKAVTVFKGGSCRNTSRRFCDHISPATHRVTTALATKNTAQSNSSGVDFFSRPHKCVEIFAEPHSNRSGRSRPDAAAVNRDDWNHFGGGPCQKAFVGRVEIMPHKRRFDSDHAGLNSQF